MARRHLVVPLSRVIVGVAQAINALLVLGGTTVVFLAIDRALQYLPAYGKPLGGDELRGHGFLFMGGAGIALLAVLGMAAMKRGHRWGAIVVIALWVLAWWPLAFWLYVYDLPGFALSTPICGAGVVIGFLAFWALAHRANQRRRPASYPAYE